MNETLDATVEKHPEAAEQTVSRFKWVGWSSLLFAIVQSVCTAFVALSGLRIVIGAAAFASAIGAMHVIDKIHTDAIRVPMVMFALTGAVFNLVAFWQVRRLRGRAASAWRQKEVSRRKFASERLQLTLSVITLILLAAESYYHIQHTGHL